MQDFIARLLPTIEHFTMLGYWLIFLISLSESLVVVGLFVPGTTIIMIAGFLASKGGFDLGDLIWFVTLGAICGDGLSFYLGKREKRQPHRVFYSAHREKAERFFQRHGRKSVFLGRFIGPMRAIIPFIAGMSGMAPRVFFAWNVTSGIAWATTYLLLGYFFGHAWQAVETWSTRVSLLLIVLFIVIICGYSLKRIIATRGQQMLAFSQSVLRSVGVALRDNPDVQGVIRRHPTFFHFWSARFRRDQFSGLPLSLLSLAFLYVLALFLGVIEDILMSDPIVTVDVQLHNLLHVFRSPEFVPCMLWMTVLGKAEIIISATLIVSLLLWLYKRSVYIIPFWCTLAGSMLFNTLGKLTFHRPRPELGVYTEHSFSFPSGHATIAVTFYGFLIYALWAQMGKWQQKVNLLFTGLCIILAIGASRIYLGVHYLSDVWGGYLLGLLWLIVGISMTEWLKTQPERFPVTMTFPARTVRFLSRFALAAELSLYLIAAACFSPVLNFPSMIDDQKITGSVTDIFWQERLPKYTETLTGRTQEPLNLIILAQSDEQFMNAFRQAGWYRAEPISIAAILKMAWAALLNTEYLTASITPYFWNARPHDFGFQKPTEAQSIRKRHHVRFWRTPYLSADGRRLYVGTASLDIGLKWGIIHKISPDIDSERERLSADFLQAKIVDVVQHVQFVNPMLGYNEYKDPFFTEGMLSVMIL